MMEQVRAHGDAALSGVIRRAPEDFRVDEIEAFAASGEGEHLLLEIEKRGMNTQFAAQRLAEWAGVGVPAIGYAGMKDRHAVTRQRFSVHLPRRQAPPIETLASDDLRVLSHGWHARKLPRGAHAGNRFDLVLRDVVGEHARIEERLQAISASGVPNFFGGQRFGHDGGNVDKARAMFRGMRVRRNERTHLLSAARSTLFNRVLARRVQDASWDRGLDGEVWMLDGTRSVFGPEPWSDALSERLARFDIHPSAPLWGRGPLRTQGAAEALELDALSDGTSLALREGLERAGLSQERRATRLRPASMQWQWQADTVLQVSFSLPPGGYATAVLFELGELHDAGAAERHRSSE
ncbi:tRNA pseudouridine(13) synthase TruD [Luteimonas vadosa]|uniref:tRNA pseudouridine synthase D n=1 Tax=Luteimonas vadosa TaxID=1165507 RepID=A0ABP9E5Y3_9GAMM